MKTGYTLTLILSLFLFLLVGCQKDSDIANTVDQDLERILATAAPEGKSSFILPQSNDYANIPQDPNNPITGIKVVLGKLLFHETGIALAPMDVGNIGKFSCASCHFAEAGFQAGRFQGIGEGGEGFFRRGVAPNFPPEQLDVQPIRTPSAMNVAYQDVMLWNGQFGATGTNAGTEAGWTEGTPKFNNHLGFQGVETQAIAGLGVHRLVIDRAFMDEKGYTPLFEAAFPELPDAEKTTTTTAALAIAAYERTLLANLSPWQQWLRGRRDVMSEEEKLGAILFFGKAGCVECHNGPSLASMSFHALGMDDLDACPEPTFGTHPANTEHLGRGGFTGNSAEYYQFKTPQLYNLIDSPFFGHGASFRSVKDVIRYKNTAIAENERVPNGALSPLFTPLNLSETEIEQLTLFVEKSLHDDQLKRYVPAAVLSGNCLPNNDESSRLDSGCD